jgi:hypothetical protein
VFDSKRRYEQVYVGGSAVHNENEFTTSTSVLAHHRASNAKPSLLGKQEWEVQWRCGERRALLRLQIADVHSSCSMVRSNIIIMHGTAKQHDTKPLRLLTPFFFVVKRDVAGTGCTHCTLSEPVYQGYISTGCMYVQPTCTYADKINPRYRPRSQIVV